VADNKITRRCGECGKRDWRVGYYLWWLFHPIRCPECQKRYWSASRRNEHILEKHLGSGSAQFYREFTRVPSLTPLTVLMEKLGQRSKGNRSESRYTWET
jgi:hypothetical protein